MEPSGPGVPPSEPERERQFVEYLLDELGGSEHPAIVGLRNVRDTLRGVGLDVDEQGFIVDSETEDVVEPYGYDSELFREVESPVNDPFEAYYRPESEIEGVIIGTKDKLHLSDLHSVYMFDGEPHPIRDDGMNIQRFIEATGMTFSTITAWSDAFGILDDADVVPVMMRGEAEHEVSLSCFGCEFEGAVDEWEEDDEDELRCPECNGWWDTFGLQTCTACQTTHWWEEVVPEEGGGMYWEPSCPECGKGPNFLERGTRYDRFPETS